MVNLQTKVSWTVGYAVPTVAFGVALALFLLGTRLYHFVPPGGSALVRIYQVKWALVTPPKGSGRCRPAEVPGAMTRWVA